MAKNKNVEQNQNEFVNEIISIKNEIKLVSQQVAHLYRGIVEDKRTSGAALEQEIRYSYKQNQNIYEGLNVLLRKEVAERLNGMDDKITALEQLQAILSELGEIKYSYQQLQAIYESLSSVVVPKLDTYADKDEMRTLVDENATIHSQQVLDAIASIPSPEVVDYSRISQEVGDKLLELLNELKANEEVVEEEEVEKIDYEKIAGDTSAKVIESLPFPEPVDYNRIDESIANAAVTPEAIAEAVSGAVVSAEAIAQAVAATINVEAIAQAVAATIDVDAIAEVVAAKIALPEVPEVTFDYDHLADVVIEKLAAKGISADVILDDDGISKIADTVADKVGTVEVIDYDRVCLAAQAAQILPDPIDYDRVAEIVDEKLDNLEKVVTLDDEGIEKIVGGVADELRNMTLVCEVEEAVAEEAIAEEVAEVEEAVVEEAPVEETVEEAPVEEVVVAEEAPVVDELAAALDPVYEEDMNGQLVDAETGLVVRLKRSFTAKMKQSDEQIKVYYSDIKNALTSYKRINSNVSWHGDRFNYGRETVAKIGINGKTLCFYLALDPNDPELKTTVYHQKDVGAQKAYENTPFMVKVKSEAASKKALRLVGILAQKLGAEEDESFQEVDYVAEYAYESTKRLFEEGDIKATKEKKVDFNF